MVVFLDPILRKKVLRDKEFYRNKYGGIRGFGYSIVIKSSKIQTHPVKLEPLFI